MGKRFTLSEPRAAIAIIAALASLLLPALRQAQERAKTIACVSNVRQFTEWGSVADIMQR